MKIEKINLSDFVILNSKVLQDIKHSKKIQAKINTLFDKCDILEIYTDDDKKLYSTDYRIVALSIKDVIEKYGYQIIGKRLKIFKYGSVVETIDHYFVKMMKYLGNKQFVTLHQYNINNGYIKIPFTEFMVDIRKSNKELFNKIYNFSNKIYNEIYTRVEKLVNESKIESFKGIIHYINYYYFENKINQFINSLNLKQVFIESNLFKFFINDLMIEIIYQKILNGDKKNGIKN